MEKELADKALLSNNSIMYRVYSLLGYTEKAQQLLYHMSQEFFTGNKFIDFAGNDRPDPLGISLAVLYDVIPSSHYYIAEQNLMSVDSKFGVTIRCRHNPFNDNVEERAVINRTDGVVVWPFVVGFTVMALHKMNLHQRARGQFKKLLSLQGFYEWYDPESGKGYGASQQLWSAALFLRALNCFV